MAGTKRKSEELEIINRQQLIYQLDRIENPKHKALIAFIYLTGARISEVLGMKKTFMDGRNIIIEPLTKESIEVLPEQDLVLVHNVACLKRKTNLPRRNIPIIMSQETPIIDIFLLYHNSLIPGSPLFDISRQHAWRIVNKNLGSYTHFLIHTRCTHLVTKKGFTDTDLMRFRGWKNTLMASTYTHLNYMDIANKMR